MQAGRLNEKIEIHSPILRRNEYGELEDNKFKKKFETKAQVIYNNGNKTIENNEIFVNYRLIFNVRIYHKITTTDRVYYDGNFYQIESIEKNKQYQLQRLNCSIINE